MNKSLIILKHEFLKTVRTKSFIILTLALPFLIILGMVIYQAVTLWYQPTTIQEVKIGYIDAGEGKENAVLLRHGDTPGIALFAEIEPDLVTGAISHG